MKHGSENGVNMEPRSGKREPRAHFGCYESIDKKRSKTVTAKSLGGPDTTRQPGLGALNKGKAQALILYKESQGA